MPLRVGAELKPPDARQLKLARGVRGRYRDDGAAVGQLRNRGVVGLDRLALGGAPAVGGEVCGHLQRIGARACACLVGCACRLSLAFAFRMERDGFAPAPGGGGAACCVGAHGGGGARGFGCRRRDVIHGRLCLRQRLLRLHAVDLEQDLQQVPPDLGKALGVGLTLVLRAGLLFGAGDGALQPPLALLQRGLVLLQRGQVLRALRAARLRQAGRVRGLAVARAHGSGNRDNEKQYPREHDVVPSPGRPLAQRRGVLPADLRQCHDAAPRGLSRRPRALSSRTAADAIAGRAEGVRRSFARVSPVCAVGPHMAGRSRIWISLRRFRIVLMSTAAVGNGNTGVRRRLQQPGPDAGGPM